MRLQRRALQASKSRGSKRFDARMQARKGRGVDTIPEARRGQLEALAKPSETQEERKRRAKAAWQHIFDLCEDKREWRMCIPPDPDDSDILLGAALHDHDALIGVLESEG